MARRAVASASAGLLALLLAAAPLLGARRHSIARLRRRAGQYFYFKIRYEGLVVTRTLAAFNSHFINIIAGDAHTRVPGNFQFHHGFGSLPPVLNSRPVNPDNLGTQIARLGSLMDWPAKTGPSGPSYGGW